MDKITFDTLFERSFATAVKHDFAAYKTDAAGSVSVSWAAVRKQLDANHPTDMHGCAKTTDGYPLF